MNLSVTSVTRPTADGQGFRPRRTGPARWLTDGREVAERLPDPIADRARVQALWVGAEERPGRPLDPDVADMVYSTVEYLTRPSGVLFATVPKVLEMTAQAIARRNLKRKTPLGKVTRSKVQAVLRVLLAAGWLTHERKTCRARVLVVATPRTEAAEVGAALVDALGAGLPEAPAARADEPIRASTTEHCCSTTDSPNGQSLNNRETCSGPAEPEPDTAARVTAGRLVDTWRAQLRCRRAPNPAGAWYRCLHRALVDYQHDLPAMAWALNEALAQLVTEHGHAALSWDAIAARLPSGTPGRWTTPDEARAAHTRRATATITSTSSTITSRVTGLIMGR